MTDHKCYLVQVFIAPDIITKMDLTTWDLLLRQAQAADVVAKLWYHLAEKGLLDHIPPQALVHLESARVLAAGHKQSVRWEINRISRAFGSVELPVILLKGAAYMMADLPFASGRIFSDIDLLVEQTRLESAERVLLLGGWLNSHHNAYDQRYYRDWMHELPAFRHMTRKSILDVHHTILPLTSRSSLDVSKMFSDIVPLASNPKLFTLSPIDMVLHSAAHLFHEGEFEHGFRGLMDLDGLLRHFSIEVEDFWSTLISRASELDLNKPLYYALRYTELILGTPVPDNALSEIADSVPKGFSAKLMDPLFLRALQPNHQSCDRFGSGLARWLLFIRSHYIKMPLQLLIPHLLRKAFISEKKFRQ